MLAQCHTNIAIVPHRRLASNVLIWHAVRTGSQPSGQIAQLHQTAKNFSHSPASNTWTSLVYIVLSLPPKSHTLSRMLSILWHSLWPGKSFSGG